MPDQTTEDLTTLMYFLLYAMDDKPRMMYGARRVEEAFAAACRLAFPSATPEEVAKRLRFDEVAQ